MDRALTLTDDTGAAVALEKPASRVVSLVPSLTETLVHLGIGKRLVGATRFCIHPAKALSHVVRIGGTKNPDIEKILALDPDLVVANMEENKKEDVEKLKRYTSVFITYPRDVLGAMKTVLDLAHITGLERAASLWKRRCVAALDRVRSETRTALPTLCLIWRNPWMAAGRDTYMSDLLSQAGFENILGEAQGRYPRISLESALERKVRFVLLPDEPYRFDEGDAREIAALFTASDSTSEVITVDGTALAWFGWRTLEGLAYVEGLRKDLERDPSG